MAVFTAGDSPVSVFEYDVPDAPEGADVVLVVGTSTVPAELDGDLVSGSWAGLELLPLPGLYPVRVELVVGARREGQLVDWLVVVDPADEWHTVESARFEWDGAPQSDGTLFRLLATAREQVEAYAYPSDLEAGKPVPERLRQAQITQARNMFNATITNGEQSYESGGTYVTVRPLDWAVKQLIRPQRGGKVLR